MDVIDLKVLAERKAEMEDDYQLLVDTYVSDTKSTLSAIEKAVKSNSPQDLQQHSHALKSSSGYMGALRVVALAAKLETAAREGRANSEIADAALLRLAVKEALGTLELANNANEKRSSG